MRPGQAAPVFQEIYNILNTAISASMRPGQAAPVFEGYVEFSSHRPSRFNEAGAGCPGIPGLNLEASSRLPGLQ